MIKLEDINQNELNSYLKELLKNECEFFENEKSELKTVKTYQNLIGKYGKSNELDSLTFLVISIISEYSNQLRIFDNHMQFISLSCYTNVTNEEKEKNIYEPVLPFNVIYSLITQEYMKALLYNLNFDFEKENLTDLFIFRDIFDTINFTKLKNYINNKYDQNKHIIKKQNLLSDIEEAEKLNSNHKLKESIQNKTKKIANKRIKINQNLNMESVFVETVKIIRELTENVAKEFNENSILERVDRQGISLITMAQIPNAIARSLYDNINSFMDFDYLDKEKYDNREQITSGIVNLENRNYKLGVIYEGYFEPLGNYIFTAQTEKVLDVLQEILITQYLDKQNPTIFINLKTLAKEIGVDSNNLRKRIHYIMESLQIIRFFYEPKGRLKKINDNTKDKRFESFGNTRIISSYEYNNLEDDVLEVNFDNKYAYTISLHNFFQLPKECRRKINDNQFPYGYPLVKYIFELCRENRYTIKFSTLYNRIKKIPRIETVKSQKASPTQKIYEPLIKTFNELNSLGYFIIKFENENFLIQNSSKRNMDWEKILNTNIIIDWKNKPNYENISKQKQRKQQKIENERKQQYINAINQKALK